jgi:hypothetical protein
MSCEVNEVIKENILEDVLELVNSGDVWDVIFAIEKEFGIAKVPSPNGGVSGFVNALVELRFEEACQ